MFDFSPEASLFIEISAVVAGLAYLILLIKQSIWCWSFGIVTSLLSVMLFMQVSLFSEAILYLFYAAMGLYGWIVWSKKGKNSSEIPIRSLRTKFHIVAIVCGAGLSAILGWFMNNYADSEMSYLDAHTTVFSFLATYLEAQKILSAWIYWIIINGASVYLYSSRELDLYSWLMALYFVLSFVGFYIWNISYQKEDS